MKNYFLKFGDKQICFEDLSTYFHLLENSEIEKASLFLLANVKFMRMSFTNHTFSQKHCTSLVQNYLQILLLILYQMFIVIAATRRISCRSGIRENRQRNFVICSRCKSIFLVAPAAEQSDLSSL